MLSIIRVCSGSLGDVDDRDTEGNFGIYIIEDRKKENVFLTELKQES